MNGIEEAIIRTVLYADVFNFPMTIPEIHHFLISRQSYALADVKQAFLTSAILRSCFDVSGAYIVCRDRPEIVTLREEREAATARLLPLAEQYGAWLARLPFVRMVAITGALSMRNPADQDDDLDYVLVTAAGRVWTARAFAVLLVRIVKLRGVTLCPNYVLAETALTQERHDIFMAHEVAQMIPVFGQEMYARMRGLNDWVFDHMANTCEAFYQPAEYQPSRGWHALKAGLEWLLMTPIGAAFEAWEFRRKRERFNREMKRRDHSAVIDADHVKGHFNDHGHPVLRKYRERLLEFGLHTESPPLQLAGD